MPAIGETAPDFTLPATDGTTASQLRLSALRPAPVVLFFYPRDATPGCTLEAQAFTRLAGAFAALGARVVGISKDSLAAHERFCRKQGLGVLLASDAEAQTCEAYGTWVEKRLYGRVYMGIERATFLIDGAGRVAQRWRGVKVAGHAEAVLAALRDL
jgi:peroxiredoxin Q/BCP